MPADSNARYANYPDAGDVEILLRSSSFWPTDASKKSLAQEQAAIGAAAAADEWEKRASWRPFLASYAETSPQTRPFAMPRDGQIDFRGACQSVISVNYGGSSIEASQYELLDGENLAFEPPYTGIRLGGGRAMGAWSSAGQTPNRVLVSARWGRCETVPPFVWQQILQAGALIALTSVENLQSIASISQDGFSKAFDVVGIITQKDLLTTWSKTFLQSAMQYRRDVSF